jgi:hypothetical protein
MGHLVLDKMSRESKHSIEIGLSRLNHRKSNNLETVRAHGRHSQSTLQNARKCMLLNAHVAQNWLTRRLMDFERHPA